MVTTTLGKSRSKIDARPVRPTSNRTPWDRALSLRDQIASAVRSTLDKEALEAAVFVSANGQYPPWIKLEAWLPGAEEPECRERTELTFTIDTKPYYEHDTVISAQLSRGKIQIAVKERPDFQDHHVAEWVAYALRRGPKPSNYTPGLDALGTSSPPCSRFYEPAREPPAARVSDTVHGRDGARAALDRCAYSWRLASRRRAWGGSANEFSCRDRRFGRRGPHRRFSANVPSRSLLIGAYAAKSRTCRQLARRRCRTRP